MKTEHTRALKQAAEKVAEAINLLQPIHEEMEEAESDDASDLEDCISSLEEAKTNLENLR